MDFREPFYDALVKQSSRSAGWLQNASKMMMKKQLPDRPDLWEKLTPDYPIGCKRIILTDDYLPTLTRDNVTLETGGIDRFTENGIVVDGSEHEFDLVILATGFRTVEFMHPIKIHGVDGTPLSEVWDKGARALYGVTVPSLPNFAMLYGPNTNLGHNSIILMIEAQARYVLTLIDAVLQARQQAGGGGSLVITPRASRVDEFNEEIQAVLATSSFAHPNCRSWYKNADGVVTNNWSGTVVDYQKILAKVRWEDFDYEGTGPVVAQKMRSRAKGAVTNIGRVREESYLGIRQLVAVVGVVGAIGVLRKMAPHLLPQMMQRLRLLAG